MLDAGALGGAIKPLLSSTCGGVVCVGGAVVGGGGGGGEEAGRWEEAGLLVVDAEDRVDGDEGVVELDGLDAGAEMVMMGGVAGGCVFSTGGVKMVMRRVWVLLHSVGVGGDCSPGADALLPVGVGAGSVGASG